MLPANCEAGMTGLIIGQPSVHLNYSFISQPTPAVDRSADTNLLGSFCPRRTGKYNLYFEGEFGDVYTHTFQFYTNPTSDLNGSITNITLYITVNAIIFILLRRDFIQLFVIFLLSMRTKRDIHLLLMR